MTLNQRPTPTLQHRSLPNQQSGSAEHGGDKISSVENLFFNLKRLSLCKYNKQIDPSKPIRYKWPTLLELYKHLFHEEPKNLHNSLMDCMVCLRCFLKIYNNYDFAEGKFDVFVNRFMPVKK